MTDSKEAFVAEFRYVVLGLLMDAIAERRGGAVSALWLEVTSRRAVQMMEQMHAALVRPQTVAETVDRFVAVYPLLDPDTRQKVAGQMRESLKLLAVESKAS